MVKRLPSGGWSVDDLAKFRSRGRHHAPIRQKHIAGIDGTKAIGPSSLTGSAHQCDRYRNQSVFTTCAKCVELEIIIKSKRSKRIFHLRMETDGMTDRIVSECAADKTAIPIHISPIAGDFQTSGFVVRANQNFWSDQFIGNPIVLIPSITTQHVKLGSAIRQRHLPRSAVVMIVAPHLPRPSDLPEVVEAHCLIGIGPRSGQQRQGQDGQQTDGGQHGQ